MIQITDNGLTIKRYLNLVAAIVLLISAGQLLANPVPKGIKGIDHRVTVNGADPAWQAVGRVHLAGRGFCTGVLVSPNTVLTAAHCVWNVSTNKPIPAQYLFFASGYHKESFLAISNIKKIHFPQGFRPSRDISLDTAEKDLALLELNHPINQVTPLSIKRFSAQELAQLDSTVIQAGFSRDRPYILTVDKQCMVRTKVKSKELIAHECDAIRGDSGSPLMIQTNEGLQIVAIHSSNRHLKNRDAIGLAVPSASIDKLPYFPMAYN